MRTAQFEQTATERVLMGLPAAEALQAEADRLGAQRVFLIVSDSLIRQSDEIARIETALGARCAGVCSGIQPHVPRASVLTATEMAREAKADLIVSVGGGSVTDAAKIVALALRHDFRRHEDFEPHHFLVTDAGELHWPAFEGPSVRVICVPTTLSGGEFNPLSGATDERIRIKQGYTHRQMVPVSVILDPALTRHTPEWLWLSTGVRAIDHACETLGSLLSNDFCDGLATSALQLLAEGLRRVKQNPDDLEARLKCQIGAWQSMIPVIAGVPMGISHATGHALGGTFDVPHGHTSCVMAPFALAYNAPVNAARQTRISSALGQPGEPASEVIDRFIRDLGMPRSLGEVGVHEHDLTRLAEAVMHDLWTRTNPRPLDDLEAVRQFLSTAL
ncbi:iron-containing alcohol dehydrogenase [Nevskia ramosa]|uniref:iron-containing alcohol dehydrogenase n=1 Tax=Nevskia ramosa TaxID=64002 RepID=UPI000491F0AD|nr:iron-containing alcohol dehydrogenase [Nevskia ramosa]